ncbi:MAG: hypothetical protein ACRDYB_03125 [Acidimicrobiales bacterium]
MIVGIDQRGCGRPLAIDALEQLRTNNTAELVEDIEAVREHLQVEHWMVTGVSWAQRWRSLTTPSPAALTAARK